MAITDVLRVDDSRWKAAQEFELRFARQSVDAGDDSNHWWYSAFERYKILYGKYFQKAIEVGCGPHTNIRLLLPSIKIERLWLEDPLIDEYRRLSRKRRILKFLQFRSPTTIVALARRYPVTFLSEKLEDLSLPDQSIDLCLCINVLDHVQDVDRCLMQVRRILKRGVLVLGQDLSNEQDREACPESWSDTGHPMKMDAEYLDSRLGDMTTLFYRILPREKGRNPRCHYGTYLFIGRSNHDSNR
ncbi:MAG: methyltransferase domain-containing protein [Deltaproteobacteria bacterium]|nr:methyltransferase domain-containing protein [Deltaproteobacteria bacterium]